ncbi:hypothetical protein [Streptomyces pactum]|uniref:Histone protein n=1 Tax=Streptomyces pactum TaxID=68249 RepID=A0A1S6J2J7_9ACTN|nr:hypothetical protein [Streptomyces pactum]AQS65983.1 hypothetical protein B1H29_02675 [Streptomyces pactum]
MSDSKAVMAAVVAGGYLLGRTKKARLAFVVGSYLVGRRVGLSPGQVLSQGLTGLQQTPQLRELTDQVRGELLTAVRTAVTAAADRRLTGLADTLRDRTDALTGTGTGRQGDGDDERGPYDGYDAYDEYDPDDADDDAPDEAAFFDAEEREEDRRPAPPRKTGEKAPPGKPAPPAKKAAKKAAEKTAKKAVPAKKTASPAHRHGGVRR